MNKYYLFFVSFLFFNNHTEAQQSENFGYRLTKKVLKHGILYVDINPEDTMLEIITNDSFPFCDIKSYSNDTLTIQFWDIKAPHSSDKPATNSQTSNLSSIHNGKLCYFKITKWDKIKAFSFFSFKSYTREGLRLPYRYFGITAVNLPFRIVFDSVINVESQFLNLNLAGLWHFGKTRIYKNHNIPVSTREFGFGPFFGLRAIERENHLQDGFGLNLGACLTYSFNKLQILGGLGIECNFFEKKSRSFMTFGIGYEIFSQFEPEFKSE